MIRVLNPKSYFSFRSREGEEGAMEAKRIWLLKSMATSRAITLEQLKRFWTTRISFNWYQIPVIKYDTHLTPNSIKILNPYAPTTTVFEMSYAKTRSDKDSQNVNNVKSWITGINTYKFILYCNFVFFHVYCRYLCIMKLHCLPICVFVNLIFNMPN